MVTMRNTKAELLKKCKRHAEAHRKVLGYLDANRKTLRRLQQREHAQITALKTAAEALGDTVAQNDAEIHALREKLAERTDRVATLNREFDKNADTIEILATKLEESQRAHETTKNRSLGIGAAVGMITEQIMRHCEKGEAGTI